MQLTQTEKEEWIVEKLTSKHVERVEDIKISQGPFVEAIKIALESGKFTTTNAAVSLPVSSSIVKVIAMPLMSELEMKNAELASLLSGAELAKLQEYQERQGFAQGGGIAVNTFNTDNSNTDNSNLLIFFMNEFIFNIICKLIIN